MPRTSKKFVLAIVLISIAIPLLSICIDPSISVVATPLIWLLLALVVLNEDHAEVMCRCSEDELEFWQKECLAARQRGSDDN